MLVRGQHLSLGFVDTQHSQHGQGVPGILAGQHVSELQNMQGAQADIREIANWCGHHVQRSAWIILRTARLFGGLARQVKRRDSTAGRRMDRHGFSFSRLGSKDHHQRLG